MRPQVIGCATPAELPAQEAQEPAYPTASEGLRDQQGVCDDAVEMTPHPLILMIS